MCYVMHLLRVFHFSKPDKTGKKSIHSEASWHSYCGLSCFVASPDQIPLWSLSSEAQKILFWHDYFAYSID